jgi:PhnB protein
MAIKINPHLSFDGRCEEALKFYETALGGRIAFMTTYEKTPAAGMAPKDWGGKVIHATFMVGDQAIGAADAPPPHYRKPQGFAVTIDVDEPAEAERVFKALSDKGAVTMPIQETFWARRFGMVTDRFGTPWMINCSKPM